MSISHRFIYLTMLLCEKVFGLESGGGNHILDIYLQLSYMSFTIKNIEFTNIIILINRNYFNFDD